MAKKWGSDRHMELLKLNEAKFRKKPAEAQRPRVHSTPVSMNFGAPMQHGRGRMSRDFVDFEGLYMLLRVTSANVSYVS